MQVLTSLVTSTFQTTLNFLANEGISSLTYNASQRFLANDRVASGIKEVSNFLNLLSAMLDRSFLREAIEKQLEEANAGSAPNTPEPQGW